MHLPSRSDHHTCPGPIQADVAAVPGQNARDNVVLVEVITPHQSTNFIFPEKQFGKETFSCSFIANWFKKWKWLHYIEAGDRVACFSCVEAMEKLM